MSNASLTLLEQIAKPEVEPITLDTAIDWIHGSSADETKMRTLIPSCRSILERKLGIAFCTQQLRATYEFELQTTGLIGISWAYENMLCILPRPPLQSIDVAAVETDIDIFTPITTATYDTIKQFPAQIYFYGDAFGMVEYPWWINLNREPRVQITYTCGYKQVNDIPRIRFYNTGKQSAGTLKGYPGLKQFRASPTVKPATLIPRVAVTTLNDLLLLQARIEIRTPSGTVKIVYQDTDNVWSAVTPLQGTALYYAQQFAPKATAHILIRYRSDVEEEWKLITQEGTPYIVRAEPVDVDHKQALLLLYCEALQV